MAKNTPFTKQEMVDYVNLTKQEMIGYVDPLFNKLTSDMNEVKKETRQTGVLVEEMNKKIDLALEISQMVNNQQIVSKNHEFRLTSLEKDVQVIKLAITARNEK